MPENVSENTNGFYAAYFTGAIGSSLGMFIFKDGIITGADVGGGKYDGNYTVVDDGNFIEGSIKFILPVGNQSITGAAANAEPINIEVPIKFPTVFDKNNVYKIETPIGPINAKFDKIREA